MWRRQVGRENIPCQNPVPSSQPIFNHVVLVVEENHSYSEVIGNSSMPYFNSLASLYGLATQYFENAHPSMSCRSVEKLSRRSASSYLRQRNLSVRPGRKCQQPRTSTSSFNRGDKNIAPLFAPTCIGLCLCLPCSLSPFANSILTCSLPNRNRASQPQQRQ
jgi:hypothetical protein